MNLLQPNQKFAAFVICYNKPTVIENTITSILSQTLPPSYILIVDNSTNTLTKEWFNDCGRNNIGYLEVGYNSGPAGAAYLGLKTLVQMGYDWMYWGDDDNPPTRINQFELLLTSNYPNLTGIVGQVGSVGHLFDYKKAKIQRIADEELTNTDNYLVVDTIAGGMCKIISRNVILASILPTPKLFFGFEELEYDLRIKEHGFISIVNTQSFYQSRKESGRLGYKKSTNAKKALPQLWRTYYSYRNLLYILWTHKAFWGVCTLLFRIIGQSAFSFKYGIKYGFRIMYYNMMAILHFLVNKYGLTVKSS